jgi:hypothetical protein
MDDREEHGADRTARTRRKDNKRTETAQQLFRLRNPTILAAMGTLPTFDDPLAFGGLDAEALVERIVPREVAVTDQPANDVTAVGVRDLFEAAHGCISCVCWFLQFFSFFFLFFFFPLRFEGVRPAGTGKFLLKRRRSKELFLYIFIALASRVWGRIDRFVWGGPVALGWWKRLARRFSLLGWCDVQRREEKGLAERAEEKEARSGSTCKPPLSLEPTTGG